MNSWHMYYIYVSLSCNLECYHDISRELALAIVISPGIWHMSSVASDIMQNAA